MKIAITVEGARAEIDLDGHALVISQRGPVKTLTGVKNSERESTFGGLVSSVLLDAVGKIMDGANVVIDETDNLNVWHSLPDEVADQVYEAMV